jgi:hypothetical protein
VKLWADVMTKGAAKEEDEWVKGEESQRFDWLDDVIRERRRLKIE